MKKLLFLILIVFLFSCEKQESTYCWQCEVVSAYYPTDRYIYPSSSTTNTIIKCDMTEKEIILYEKEQTFVTTIKIDIYHISKTTNTCNCKKQ